METWHMTLHTLLLTALKQRWLELKTQHPQTANNNDIALMFRAILLKAELLAGKENEQVLRDQLHEVAHQFPQSLKPLCKDLAGSCLKVLEKQNVRVVN
jgi:hypothetical protein